MHHSCKAWAMNSGPLSIRRWVGAGYSLSSSSIVSFTSTALQRRPTRMARQPRLNSSTTFRTLNAAIHRLVELTVDPPSVVRVFGTHQLSAATSRPGALAPVRQGPLEPCLPPDPLHTLGVDAPALQPQPAVEQPTPPAHRAPGQFTDSPAQLLLFDRRHRHGPASGVAVLAGQPESTPRRNPELILQKHDGSATTLRAQKVPRRAPTASLRDAFGNAEACGKSIAMSSSASANRRDCFGQAFGKSLVFSCSSG